MRSVPSDSVYAKTVKGIREVEVNRVKLPRDLGLVFARVDGIRSAAELLPGTDLTALRVYQALDLLAADGYIELVPEPAAGTESPENKPQLAFAPPQSERDTAERVRQLNELVQAGRRSRERSEREARRVLTDFGTPPYNGRKIAAAESNETAESGAERVDRDAAPQYVPSSLERAMSRLGVAGEGRPGERVTARSEGPAQGSTPPQASEAAPSVAPRPASGSERREPELAPNVSDASADIRGRAEAIPREGNRERARPAHKGEDAHRAARVTRRHRLKPMLGALAIALIAIAAAAIAWFQFMPLHQYVGAMQRTLSQRLQQPVRVAAVRYLFFPQPRLVLENVTLAKGQGLRAERIETRLLPWAALGNSHHLELVEAYGVEVDAGTLTAIAASTRPSQPGALQVERLRLVNAKLKLPNAELGAFDGEIVFGPDGAIEEALFTDDRVRLELTPIAEGVRFILNAREWQMPYGPPVQFSELLANGLVNRTHEATAQFNGRAGGGTVAGTLTVRWPGAISMLGQFKVEQARIHDLAEVFMKSVGARGILNTSGRFSMQAAEWAALTQDPLVNAQFSIARGELTNVDLLRALQSPSGGAIRGGRTPFEKLTGVLRLSKGDYSYRELHLVSGPLNATGLIDVASDGALSGRISTELGSRGRVVARSVLVLTGTVADPQVKR